MGWRCTGRLSGRCCRLIARLRAGAGVPAIADFDRDGAALETIEFVDREGVPTLRGRVVSFFHRETGWRLRLGWRMRAIRLRKWFMMWRILTRDFASRRRKIAGREDWHWCARNNTDCHRCRVTWRMGSTEVWSRSGGSGGNAVHKNPLSKHGWMTDLLGRGTSTG